MSYRGFNNFSKLRNGDLTAKIRQGIHSCDFMDRTCNFYFPSNVNSKCAFQGKCWRKCLKYKVKCMFCDAIYIGNTFKMLKKYKGDNFYNVQCLLTT